MADLSKLFHGAPDGASFLDKLDLRPPERTSLETARAKVRDTLRTAFAAGSKQQFGFFLEPKFFTQGSYAYKTINRPASPPRQQKDLDDGLYLPMSFVKGERPSLAAAIYFEFVDSILKRLCEAEGWTFDTRPTCARAVIAKDAHVDIPLYAIPDHEFRAMAKAALGEQRVIMDSALNRRLDVWEALPSDQVLLAHREEDWKTSDPRKIQRWFLSAVETYGEQLRRICRYLKAWRDHQGEAAEALSSICLMACVFKVYVDPQGAVLDRRDDRSLLTVAKRLADLLSQPVLNPADPDEKLCARLSDDDRRRIVDLAKVLAGDLQTAMDASDAARSVLHLQHAFGPRLPDRSDLVILGQTVTSAVRSEPAKAMPAPVVGRRISG